MTQQRAQSASLRANLARSGRVWGASPTSNFLWFDRRANYKKCATVATVALLAGIVRLVFITPKSNTVIGKALAVSRGP